jgi:hypothetical protein
VWTTKTKPIGGCRYYVSFIDDHTRKAWVYFMKHKGEVFQHFLNFKTMVEKKKGVSIKCLSFDGREEYFSNVFHQLKMLEINMANSLVLDSNVSNSFSMCE